MSCEDIGDSASPLEQPYINHGPEKGVAMGFFDDFFAFHHLYDGNSNIHNGKNFQESKLIVNMNFIYQ